MFYPSSTNVSQKTGNVKSIIFSFLSIIVFFTFSSCQKESISDSLLLENEVINSEILSKEAMGNEKRVSPNGCQCTYRVLGHSSTGGSSYRIEVNEAGVLASDTGDEYSFFSGSGNNWFSSDVSLNSTGYPTSDTEDLLPYQNQSMYDLKSYYFDLQFNGTGAWSIDLEISCEGTFYNGSSASNTFTRTITRPANVSIGAWWKGKIDCIGCWSKIDPDCGGQQG